jgi:hypothetical protein
VWALKKRHGVSLDAPLPPVADMIRELESLPEEPACIEAIWDGDTVSDWFVVVLAIFQDPAGVLTERHVAWITSSNSEGRISECASSIGGQIAAHFEVPFFFAPDIDAPRWKP